MKIPKIATLAVKETRHILRDPRSLVLIFLLPVVMIMLYGYAVDLDLRNVPLAVVDFDNSEVSRLFMERMQGSGHFSFVSHHRRVSQAREEINAGRAFGILVFPEEFAREAVAGRAEVQLLLDGSDANTATITRGYFLGFIDHFNRSSTLEEDPFSVRTRILYNPVLRSTVFIVPGLAGVLLMMICALMTSVAITREKEFGTMELVLTTPIRPYQVIVGKVLPYILIAFMEALLIVSISRFWFEVPVRGSLALLTVMTLGYVFCALAIGITISAMVHSQQVAMSLALVGTLLPSVMLSGFIFPLASMPLPLQLASRIIPATYYLRIIRGIMLKDIGWVELWPELATITGIGMVFLLIGMKKFNTRLR